MQLREYFRKFIQELNAIYPAGEAGAIADLVFREVTGMSPTRRISRGDGEIPAPDQQELERMLRELAGYRPVQYVLGHAPFLGLDLKVDPSVLIPRPETGELVEWITAHGSGLPDPPGTIVDLGTGSGCIAIALKQRFPGALVIATDCSAAAIALTQSNSRSLELPVRAIRANLLDPAEDSSLPVLDLVVSNPPYISPSEAEDMAPHVLNFEPGDALFAPPEDPLVFYRSILRLAEQKLAPGGSVFVEINESLGPETAGLFEERGWKTDLRKDLQGKDRMIRAWRNG